MSRFWERQWYEVRGGLLQVPLALASVGFRAGVAIHSRLVSSQRVDGPLVVSVGNLTVGGSGKTPVVIAISQLASGAGRKVAVLSRGYGRHSQAERVFDSKSLLPCEEVGDEPRLIAQRCPEAKVWVGAQRVRSALAARGDGADFILLDDGMQHRKLARDVDIVVVDSVVGFGNGQMLPWGPLREPLSALNRASLIWLRNTGPMAPKLEALLSGMPLVQSEPKAEVVDGSITGQKVMLLAALARPSAFRRTVSALGADICSEFFFPDHHFFSPRELEDVSAEAGRARAVVVTTEKDLQRLPQGFPCKVVRLTEVITKERDLLMKQLKLV